MSHPKQFPILLCLTLFFLCGCSNDNALEEENKSTSETTTESVNVVFRLQSNQSSILTRATETVEESGLSDNGLSDEYKVTKVRVYFFDSATKLFTKSVELQGLVQNQVYGWEYEAKPILAPRGTFDIFVIANTDRIINKETEDEFLAYIDNQTYDKGEITDIPEYGFVMTNRVVDIETLNRKIPEKSSDEVTTIKVKLERVVARLDVAVNDVFELRDDIGHAYATVNFTDYYIVNYPRSYYMYRHIAALTTLEEPVWTMPTNFGTISIDEQNNSYVIDPYFFKKKPDATNFTNQDNYYANFYSVDKEIKATDIKWKALNPANPSDPKFSTTYCLENCMLAPSQKNGYSTGVLFKATMRPKSVWRMNSTGTDIEEVTDPVLYAESILYYDYNFFNSSDALVCYVKKQMPGATSVDYEAQQFDKTDGGGYHCYYKYWIRHLDNHTNNDMGVMEFAIVRNNFYRMLVTSVKDLGFGGTGKIEPNPDIPDEGESSLKVRLNVLPWVKREINVEL